MFRRLALVVVLVPALSGCLVDMLATTAIEGELQKKSLESSMKALDYAERSTGDVKLQQALAAYKAETGENPPSLEALVPNYIDVLPRLAPGMGYDPETGTIERVGAGAMNPDDAAMQQIREAINKYGYATGYYPPSLQALVPTYLAAVPKASNGQDFMYYPQDGTLINPAQPTSMPQPAPGRRNTSAAGVGPLGETLTGIGIQNELNTMNQSGVNAAGSRARQGAGDVQTQRNSQIEDALRDNGF